MVSGTELKRGWEEGRKNYSYASNSIKLLLVFRGKSGLGTRVLEHSLT